MNFTWQSADHSEIITIPATAETGAHLAGTLKAITPGIGLNGDDDFQQFDADHVLQRVRGSMAHNAQGRESSSVTDWFAFSVAAVRIPKGLTFPETGIDLFDNSEGDDYLFRMDAVCNAGTGQAQPNWHDVDSKSKRRFEVGDTIQFLWSLVNPAQDTQAKTVEFCMNLRLLWKLS